MKKSIKIKRLLQSTPGEKETKMGKEFQRKIEDALDILEEKKEHFNILHFDIRLLILETIQLERRRLENTLLINEN